MGYIIVWRHNHRDPFVDTTDHDFLEDYSSYEAADEAAKAALNPNCKHYFEYAIYEEVTS